MKETSGFTLVEIMVVVAIIALLATLVIPNMVRARTSANDTAAKATLKAVSTALETYMTTNGSYPVTTTALITASPSYITKDYFVGAHSGFNFTATLAVGTYEVSATPLTSNQGSTTFTVSTGGIISP